MAAKARMFRRARSSNKFKIQIILNTSTDIYLLRCAKYSLNPGHLTRSGEARQIEVGCILNIQINEIG